MWVFTDVGFFSTVEVDEREGAPWGCDAQGTRVMVRARSSEQLLTLLERYRRIEDAVVYTSSYSDYPYRIVVDKIAWASVVQAMALQIDYHNFKKHVKDSSLLYESKRPYLRVLHRIWALLASVLEMQLWWEEWEEVLL